MKIEEPVEPHVGDFVAADHEERLVVEEILDLLHAARAAEQLRFVRVVQLYAELRAVAERRRRSRRRDSAVLIAISSKP